MKKNFKKHKKMWVLIGGALFIAAVVWAAAELSGQADAMAQDAGSNSFDLELTTYETLKKPKSAPDCDWTKDKELREKIDANDTKYKELVEKAKGELKDSGKVSDDTGKGILDLAAEYKSLQDEYSEMWKACKCKTRSNVAKELGNTRVKSAEVVVSNIDEKKLKEMTKAQEKLKKARKEYVKQAQADDEISDADKKDVQANIIPKVNNMIPVFAAFVENVTGLLNEAQQTAQKSTNEGGIFGALKAVKEGPKLLKNVKALLTVAKGMLTNVKDLLADAKTLAK